MSGVTPFMKPIVTDREFANLAELAKAVAELIEVARVRGREPSDVAIPADCGRLVMMSALKDDGSRQLSVISMPTESDIWPSPSVDNPTITKES